MRVLRGGRSKAIERGVAYLKSQQGKDGNFPSAFQHRNGGTGMAGLALLECGLPGTDPVIERTAAPAPERWRTVAMPTFHIHRYDKHSFDRQATIQGIQPGAGGGAGAQTARDCRASLSAVLSRRDAGDLGCPRRQGGRRQSAQGNLQLSDRPRIIRAALQIGFDARAMVPPEEIRRDGERRVRASRRKLAMCMTFLRYDAGSSWNNV